MTITDIFRKHNVDKHQDVSGGHPYGPTYEAILNPVRDRVRSVLELGILWGSSLRAWREIFPGARVVGVDINVPRADVNGAEMYQADATSASELNAAIGESRFDLIVDDASHWEHEQMASFGILRVRLNPGGIYVVEDIQWDNSHRKFEDLGFEVFDLRAEGDGYRHDNVLAVYRAPSSAGSGFADTCWYR
jgi:trans-aconitate methyltransferase